MINLFEDGLDRNPVDHCALIPVTFMERTASVNPERPAVLRCCIRRSWAQTYSRARRLASALIAHGINTGDTVAAMLPDSAEMIEAHFGVAMAGAVLEAMNTSLEPDALAFMLDHGDARAVLVDRQSTAVIRRALLRVERPILVIGVDDSEYDGPVELIVDMEYEAFLESDGPDVT